MFLLLHYATSYARCHHNNNNFLNVTSTIILTESARISTANYGRFSQTTSFFLFSFFRLAISFNSFFFFLFLFLKISCFYFYRKFLLFYICFLTGFFVWSWVFRYFKN